MRAQARCGSLGYLALGLISAVLLVLYLIPSRILLKWLWYFNHYAAGKVGVKLSMIGVSVFGHVILFSAMTMVFLRLTRLRLASTALVLGAGAVLIELAQRWVPTRSCSLKDLGFNFAGIALGAVFSTLIYGVSGRDCDKIAAQVESEGKELKR